MPGPAIHVRNVSLVLGGNPVLHDVSLDVRAGEIHCLIGPNGGGKTSLLRCLLGEMPHTGEIGIDWGTDAEQRVGYVPQSLSFDASLPITVDDFLALLFQRRPACFGLAKRWRPQAETVLNRVGLADKRRRRLGTLSGGERQRLLLAQALTPAPGLLLLDEPLAALDESGARAFEDLLREAAAAGTTVLWIAHDLALVRRLAAAVTCVNRRVVLQGAPAEVLTPEVVERVFAGEGLPAVA